MTVPFSGGLWGMLGLVLGWLLSYFHHGIFFLKACSTLVMVDSKDIFFGGMIDFSFPKLVVASCFCQFWRSRFDVP